MSELIIDFLRHGELEGGIKYRGCLDEALTKKGRKDMDKVWARLQVETNLIISSPLSRCLEPAQAWAIQSQVPLKVADSVKELSYGDWEGLTADEIMQKYPGELEAWRENPTDLCPPSGESMQSFAARTKSFWDDLKSSDDGHVLVVAHSGSIRLLLTHVLGAPIKSTRHLAMPYACWSRVEVSEGEARLIFHDRAVSS